MYKKRIGTLFGKPRNEVIKHPGAFSGAAKAHGMSTAGYADKVLAPGSHASSTVKKRANLAQTFAKMRAMKG